MKKIMIMLFVLCSFMTACTNREKTINLVHIKNLFEKHGILLGEQALNKNNVFQMTLNDIEPESYLINDKQIISIYVYASSEGVKEGIKDFEYKTATANLVPHRRYQAANVLMLYSFEGNPEDDRIEMVVKDMKSLVE
ncbi:hypothetical protein [Paenibacillus paeoniae]|uniref:Lipoprotein n=1 Tax=Paenibacillus paeoniae TaxID=2292705 RepID=A0A371PKS7_9BACL|nr:hypothetical protein [Paenibacillus paeoniae]REK76713.1 hypothetical protein DX130_06650 [Paenibacillus paeoniae]